MISADMFIGSMIGEYQIKQLLGQSQLGAAYLALHLTQGRKATVIAFPLPEEMSAQEREQLGRRITREGEMLTHLTSPHILPVYACGMQPGYLYLITAYMQEASLGQYLKQNARFTPQQALTVLTQLAAGLDYAHGQGVVHGMLSLSNVIISGEFNVRIAGFGMLTMLNIYSNVQGGRPLTHLTNKSGAFLGQPGYIAPERVLGRPVEAHADIYALGVMLFELLTGTQPFGGTHPLDTALQRLVGPIPSVHAFCPEVPEAFDLVVSRMLERDPMRRTQKAGEAAVSFERILRTLDFGLSAAPTGIEQSMLNAQVTIPPTVNWFDEPMTPWQEPGANTMQLSNTNLFLDKTDPVIQASPQMSPTQSGPSPLTGSNPNSLAGVDPFAWWVGTSNGLKAASPVPGKFSQSSSGHLSNTRSRSRSKPAQQDRRKLVTLLGSGTVATVLTVSGISLAHIMQNTKQTQTQVANNPVSGPTTTGGVATTPTAATTPTVQQKNATPMARPTTTPQPGATAQPTAPGQQPTQPTPPPQPTPTPPPSHIGTVIGHTNQATNSAVTFTNPADGKASALVHLANGSWAACELACTHVGITVNYDPGAKMMVCPAHGATFDPANGFAYQPGSGPGTFAPLPKVTIRVNADGTITTG